MRSKFIVVRECHYVISETLQGIIHILRCVVTFVEYSLHLGVGVEVGPLPAEGCVKIPVGVEYVPSGKGLRVREPVNRTYFSQQYNEQQHEQKSCKNPQC